MKTSFMKSIMHNIEFIDSWQLNSKNIPIIGMGFEVTEFITILN